MPRLPAILCTIAVLGWGVFAVLYLEAGNSNKILVQRLADTSARGTRLESDIAAATTQNRSLATSVSSLQAEVAGGKAKIAASESRTGQLDRDLADAKAVLSVYQRTARALADEVTALRGLADSRATNASPDAVNAYKNTIAELERQLASASNGAAAPSAAGASTAVFTSRVGRATVLTVGPESSFVVLNFGSVRGAQLGQKLNVSQGTQVVATVLISDVRANFSVAQVLPDTLSGVLQKGDSALLIR